jgi:PAS domain S-box-containing protein
MTAERVRHRFEGTVMPEDVDLHIVAKDGSRHAIQFSRRQAIIYENGKPSAILLSGTDVTEHRRAEQALRESERRYRFLFEESPAGTLILDVNGTIRDMNSYFLKRLGYTREEVIGKPPIDLMPQQEHDRIRDVLRRRFLGEIIAEGDNAVYAKDGSIRWIVFSGGQTRLYEGDRLSGILITGEDVTERRKAEELEKQRQQQLIQADKMASLGILVSGMAHEINNPNNFIILNADNLADIWQDTLKILDRHSSEKGDFQLAGLPYSEVRKETGGLISGIGEGAKRIKAIVQNLKDFARQETGDMDQQVQVNAVIEAAIVILSNLIKKSTDHFSFIPGKTLPAVKGNFQKIEQVIINLLTNACQALPDRNAAVTVTTRHVPGKGILEIIIKDQGIGIPQENLKHIMDPFFTTKRDSGGTGLGLSISYSIIKDHNGDLLIESEKGKGTTAMIVLPIAVKSA